MIEYITIYMSMYRLLVIKTIIYITTSVIRNTLWALVQCLQCYTAIHSMRTCETVMICLVDLPLQSPDSVETIQYDESV